MEARLASDADILERIEAFCAQQSMGVSTFGRASIGDANLVANLKNGRSLTLKTANSVLDFIASYVPANTPAPQQSA